MKIEVAAIDRKNGMTLAELITFVASCQRNDVEPDTPIKAALGWSGRVRMIRAGE